MAKKSSFFNFLRKETKSSTRLKETYPIASPRREIWNERNYKTFAKESFVKNIVAHRGISMIAKNAANIRLICQRRDPTGTLTELDNQHPVSTLIKQPNKQMNIVPFLESAVSYFLISGNCYIYTEREEESIQLQLLRPDRIEIQPSQYQDGLMYKYRIDNNVYEIESNTFQILHIKNFHPLNDWYGLSPLEAAQFSIEQHNQCIEWNKTLLQNGARPSGAIIVDSSSNYNGTLTDEQFEQLREQLRDAHQGSDNVGKILILEGGLKWQEMSISPKDMDFIETKNSAARDIALCLGVPPQMLGIKGDNTYNNMAEARISFWEETILPLMENFCNSLSTWLSIIFQESIVISYDADSVSALNGKRQILWDNLKNTTFITDEEKREMLGFDKKVKVK